MIENDRLSGATSGELAEKAMESWRQFIEKTEEVTQRRREVIERFNQGIDKILIKNALDAAGYEYEEPTEELLRECFSDYVDCGTWADLTLEDIEELTIADMCRSLINIRR